MNTNSVNRIVSTVVSWPGIHADDLRPAGKDFLLGNREIGHLHGEDLVDIPFPKPLRDQLVAGGRALPHRMLPRSGWVSVRLQSEHDIDEAIALLKLSYDLAQNN